MRGPKHTLCGWMERKYENTCSGNGCVVWRGGWVHTGSATSCFVAQFNESLVHRGVDAVRFELDSDAAQDV